MKTTGVAVPSPGYQLFMLALCLYALGVLAFQATAPLDPATLTVLEYADFVVCIVFLLDFLVSFYRAPNRMKYFLTWGWVDLLSSIPMIGPARWGRGARVLRVIRVLRGLRAARILVSTVLQQRAQNSFLAAILVAFLLLTFCSIAILQFETAPDSNIKGAHDAVWWAVATVTTVGYGDRYPVTGEGRMIAVILMSAGVGLFGVFSGYLASWFLSPPEKEELSDLAALKEEVTALRRAIEKGALSTKAT